MGLKNGKVRFLKLDIAAKMTTSKQALKGISGVARPIAWHVPETRTKFIP